MCQTVFTRSVHSSSYYFSPVGQILWPSSCTVCHENNCALHKFSVKKTFFCLLFFQQVPIQVCCVTIFDTHFRWYSFKFKMTRDHTQMILLKWYLTQILTITFLTDQSDSDFSDTVIWQKNGQLHPTKGCTCSVKRQSRWRGMPKIKTKTKVLRVTKLLPHISRHGENRRVQWTPGFISSLVIKLARDKTSLILRHENSAQLQPLYCMWDQTTHRLLTFIHLKLDWSWDSGVSAGGGRFFESWHISINRYITKILTLLSFLQHTTK